MTKKEHLEIIRKGRRLARTNLYYLATEVLGYDKIRWPVHGPMIEHLAQFRDYQGMDYVQEDWKFAYVPLDPDPVNVLPEWPRRRLILDPRGWYKTTLNCISHTVQLLLNFPDITIQVVHANYEHAVHEIMSRIKGAFTQNENMRYLFPEFCANISAKGKVEELGTQDHFFLPNKKIRAGTPSCSAGSIQSAGAGKHFHWIKFTDIVTEINAASGDQREKIINAFNMYQNLLISPRYFMDVEGTCYDYGDLYNKYIIEGEEKRVKEEKSPMWSMFVRGCFEKEPPEGQEETFTPEERDWPDRLVEGKKVSRFPEFFPLESLENMKDSNEWQFACQQLNNPIAADADNRPFDLKVMSWVDVDVLKRIPMYRYTMRVDTAEKITKRADYTAITVVGWDRFGRAYLVDAVMGKFLPEKTVDYMFEMYHKWRCVELGIEEASFNRGLFPSIKRVMDMDPRKWMNLVWIKRNTQEAKTERILGMQPWFRQGMLRFSNGLSDYIKEQLKKQLSQFPTPSNDDLIDCLSDHFAGKEYFGGQGPRPGVEETMKKAHDLMVQGRGEFNALMGVQQEDDLYSKVGLW